MTDTDGVFDWGQETDSKGDHLLIFVIVSLVVQLSISEELCFLKD